MPYKLSNPSSRVIGRKLKKNIMKTYYHVIEESEYNNIAWRGYYTKLDEAEKEVERLKSYFEDINFYIFMSTTKKEPEFTTM